MLFNAKKSKLMVFDTYETSSLTINGEKFMYNLQTKMSTLKMSFAHVTTNVINNATNDFIKRVNVINVQSRSLFSNT